MATIIKVQMMFGNCFALLKNTFSGKKHMTHMTHYFVMDLAVI